MYSFSLLLPPTPSSPLPYYDGVGQEIFLVEVTRVFEYDVEDNAVGGDSNGLYDKIKKLAGAHLVERMETYEKTKSHAA